MSDLDDEVVKYGRRLTPTEAEKYLGIPASTVRTWHQRRHRNGLFPMGQDRYGKPLFYEADLLAMKLRKQVRDKQGKRHHTMRDVQ